MSPPLIFVTATRSPRSQFESNSPLSRSLLRVGALTPLKLRLFDNNRKALGECYNQAIDESPDNACLVFVHDDVYIDDWMAGARVIEALQRFDIVGVAGNTRCQVGQLTWYLEPGHEIAGQRQAGVFDHPHLRGAISHGAQGSAEMTCYGPAPAAVELIDGVFMAARVDRLRQTGVRFDPALGFHFYDLDLCRAARKSGLRIGVWPIAITHHSRGGSVQSKQWQQSRLRYLEKYPSNPAVPGAGRICD